MLPRVSGQNTRPNTRHVPPIVGRVTLVARLVHQQRLPFRCARIAVALAVAGSLALAEVSPAGAAVLAKAHYIKRADAICRVEGAHLAPYLKQYSQVFSGQNPNYAKGAQVVTAIDAIKSASLTTLRGLTVPVASRAAVARIWRTYAKFIAETQKVAAAMRDDNLSLIVSLSGTASITGGRFEGLAQAFGFAVCGAGN
jgi:hypothetical protein